MSIVPPYKCCKKCGAEKPYFEFHKNKNLRDGLTSTCKECHAEKRGGSYVPGVPDGYKRCWRCKLVQELTIEFFNICRANKSGFQAMCKQCRREMYENAADQNIQRAREWAVNNPENARRNKKKWRDNHPDYHKKYYYQHRDYLLEQMSIWQRNNPERVATRNKRWAARNPEKRRLIYLRAGVQRRTRIAELPDNYTSKDWQRCFDYWHGTCAYCGKQRDFWHVLEADHFVPLNNKGCPVTVPHNVVPACKSCNVSKSDKNPLTWVMEKFGKERGRRILLQIQTYFDWVSQRQD